MNTHTPGPWHVGPITKAEARLLTAAPDLLAALKECRRVLGIRDDFAPLGHATELTNVIDKAIAKAERN